MILLSLVKEPMLLPEVRGEDVMFGAILFVSWFLVLFSAITVSKIYRREEDILSYALLTLFTGVGLCFLILQYR